MEVANFIQNVRPGQPGWLHRAQTSDLISYNRAKTTQRRNLRVNKKVVRRNDKERGEVISGARGNMREGGVIGVGREKEGGKECSGNGKGNGKGKGKVEEKAGEMTGTASGRVRLLL